MEKKRNQGIDLLRMIAMFMIVTLHVLGAGGVLDASDILSVNGAIAWFFEIMAYCAVNCYALISGYVGVDSRYKYSNIIKLWFEVVFYTVLITAIFYIFMPGTVGKKEIFNAIFPVTHGQYWYFTAYFCIFFFIPFFNYMLNTMPQEMLQKMLLSIFILFSLWPTLSNKDLFGTGNGYSALWLALLYLMGGYYKKYKNEKAVRLKKGLLIYFGCIIITWDVLIQLEKLEVPFVWNGELLNKFLLQYTSPTMLLAAIILLRVFSGVKITNKFSKLMIKIFSPLTFCVYIIHLHPLIRDYILSNYFVFFADLKSAWMVLAVLGTSLGIYMVCSCIDLIRFHLFKWLKVDKFAKWCETLVRGCVRKVLKAWEN